MCRLCALAGISGAEGVEHPPQAFSLGNRHWTDSGSTSGGTTTTVGVQGGVVAWSIAGAGLSSADPDFFSGSSVSLGSFLNFDYVATLHAVFDAWASVANIEFIQVADGGGSIGTGTFPTIRIVGGYIDGDSNTLAQAYFPGNTALAGDVAFDSSEVGFWTQHSFFLTALHEIGHTLGLDHEDDVAAIMNSAIDLGLNELQTDDINGIRALYGAQDFGANVYYMPTSQANLTLIDGAPNLTINGNGNANVITATGAGETINGAGGGDTLYGRAGNDTLDGGAGADLLYGEAGSDTFLFSSPSNGADHIFGFESGDKIALKGSAFGLPAGSLGAAGVTLSYGSAGTSGGPTLLFDPATSRLYWDADGNGGGAATQLAQVDFAGVGLGKIGTVGGSWEFETSGDFDKNGVSDALWHDSSSGAVGAWLMSTSGIKSWSPMGTVGTDWQVEASGDYDGNGTTDVLWRNPGTGQTGAWLMQDGQPTGWLNLGAVAAAWEVKGTGDFDKNGIEDILWVNSTTKVAGAWLMSEGVPGGWLNLGTLAAGWQTAGVGDFNNDGTDDVLFHNTSTGAVGAWRIEGGQPVGWYSYGQLAAGWSIKTVADLNGDGTDDVHLQNAGSGANGAWMMQNGSITGWSALPSFDSNWSLVGSGQFNGVGAEDLLWRNNADGSVVVNSLGLSAEHFLIV